MVNFNLCGFLALSAVVTMVLFSEADSAPSSTASRRLTESHRPEAHREDFDKKTASHTVLDGAHRSDVNDVIAENVESQMKPNRLLQRLMLLRNPEFVEAMSAANGEPSENEADNNDVIKEDDKRADARRCFYHALNCW